MNAGRGRRLGGAALALTLYAAFPLSAAAQERDWGETLRIDAQALHDDIAANHPGPLNPADPGFAERNDAELSLALERALVADSYADYFFALRQYVSSFDDGHLGFGAVGDTPNHFSWPGFATRYDGTGAIVVATSEPAAPVPAGARLVGCDGMNAETYASATLGRMWGRWQLESQRQQFGALLFLDEGSGYVPRARRCTFAIGGSELEVGLDWRPLATERVGFLLGELGARWQGAFAMRELADGTRWFALPSFDGAPGSNAAQTIPGMLEEIEAGRARLAAAPAIVFDLRGNGGGTSDWSYQIARLLWGDAALEPATASADSVEVDWRASPANLAEIAKSYDEWRGSAGFSDEADRWFRAIIAGLGGAIGRGEAMWREGDGPAAERATDEPLAAPLAPLAGPVYVLTDARCASACLDAVDLWTTLGAIHVGRTTSAETLYMEIRRRVLPSGLTAISVPMKVYSGRTRGSNEPAVPRYAFAGDIGDTEAVEQWIAALPRR